MDLIEPTHFDAVVVSSGLPELLIGSALARAGKSVLILDSTNSYGASWASLSGPDYVHTLINRQLQQQQQQQQPQHGQEALHSAVQQNDHHDAGCSTADHIMLQPELQLQGVSGCSLYTHPQMEEALGQKSLIIDLAPKVMYQDELIVQLLVACQAHNYLEFKLVEGSYIYMHGKLRPVPASRADLFADKLLPLAAKRSMGRFLAACMEAELGCGRLKDAFGDGPLADLLVSEGLDEQLQQVVLYGLAMADTPQQQQRQQQTHMEAAAAAGAGANSQPIAVNGSSGSGGRAASLLSAAEGFRALQLYTRSLGRYGGRGAFMAPCYGCGSLPEALVRLAAVKGAVTALRHEVKEIQLLRPEQEHQQQQGQQRADLADSGGVSLQPTPQPVTIPLPAVHEGAVVAARAASAQESDVTSAAAAAAAAARARVLLSSGQQLTTNCVVCCTDAAANAAPTNSGSGSPLLSSAAAPGSTHTMCQVACAVAVLDRSVVDSDTSLLLVFPPGSLGSQQTAVIRGLQLGPAFSVTPAGKYLLYLSAVLQNEDCSPSPGSSRSAEQLLRPAMAAMACSTDLHAVVYAAGEPEWQEAAKQQQQQQYSNSPQTVTVQDGNSICQDSECAAGDNGATAEEQQQQQQDHAALLPQALAVCYFMTRQRQQHNCTPQQQQHASDLQQQGASLLSPDSSSSSSSSPVLWCQGAAQGLIGYDAVVRGVELLYRQQFPELPWLTDPPPGAAGKPQAAATIPGDGSSGEQAEDSGCTEQQQQQQVQAAAGGGVLDEAELDAIDQLTAALMELAVPEQKQ